jgi:hypothetical protein
LEGTGLVRSICADCFRALRRRPSSRVWSAGFGREQQGRKLDENGSFA